MKPSCRAIAVPAVLFLLSGCAAERADSEERGVGAAESPLLTANLLTANLLTANLLTANLLTANSLISSTLTSSGLGAPVQTALQDVTPMGANDRTLFHYIATCALNATQSVSYTWSDSNGVAQTVTETGEVALAPGWATGPLDRTGQQLVSGCVAARVNAFGVSVHLSARSPIIAATTPSSELAAYPYVEGAFWGNLFTQSPHLSACYDPSNVAHSRADQRACATGYPDANGQIESCGIIALTGSCNDQCVWFDPWDQLYVGCGENYTLNVITVGLQ
jgi:hypothetical protein